MSGSTFKVVFLDAGTLPQRLRFDTALPIVYEAHQATADDRVAERIVDADVVVTNKVRLTADRLRCAPKLRLVCGRGRYGQRAVPDARQRGRAPALRAPDVARVLHLIPTRAGLRADRLLRCGRRYDDRTGGDQANLRAAAQSEAQRFSSCGEGHG